MYNWYLPIGLLHSDEIGEFIKKVMKNPNPEAATAFVELLDRDRDGDYISCILLHVWP